MSNRIAAIAGGSCSGKTELEGNLAAYFGDTAAFLSFDDMFPSIMSTEAGIQDWENPNLYRIDDYVRHLEDLKTGRPTTIVANSRESYAAGITHREIEPRPLILTAGFLALHSPEVRSIVDVSIFVDVPEEERRRRWIARCMTGLEDKTPAPAMLEYLEDYLIPGHNRWVEPQKDYADHIVDGTMPPIKLARTVVGLILPS